MIWWNSKADPLAALLSHRCAGGQCEASVRSAVGYLSKFGYLRTKGEPDPESVEEAVRAFRGRFALPEGDALDGPVLRAMQAPRCGLPDHRLATEEARWRKRDLTYAVTGYVGGLSRGDVDDLLELAWRDWTAVCDLRVKRVLSGSADVQVATGRSAAQGFDGPQGTLAWAQLPQGDDRPLLMRFDLDETWTRAATDRGILFRNVACHEFGHLLGLDHSSVRTALMAPYYSPGVVRPQPNDDVQRAQALYGPPQAPTPPPAPTPGRVRITLSGPLAGGSYDVTP